MDRRHRRALLWSSVVLLAFAGPLLYRVHLQRSTLTSVRQLGEVKPFIHHTTTNELLTRESLLRGVTIIVNIPRDCADECSGAKNQASDLARWIEAELVPGYTEEKNQLRLFATGDFKPDHAGWQLIVESPHAGELLPEGHSPNRPWLTVIGSDLVFAGIWDLNQPVNKIELERLLSKTVFDQYLGNYLARRTFMGPRRDQR